MFRGRSGYYGAGGYGGIGLSSNTRLFGRSQFSGGYAGYGDVGVGTLLLAALII